MPEYAISRRTLLAATGLGAAALLVGCGETVPVVTTSPHLSGPYATNLAILGETPGTQAMLQPFQQGDFSQGYNNLICQNDPNGTPTPVSRTTLPSGVKAAVYYPYVGTASTSPLYISRGGPFPVLLFAHIRRNNYFGCPNPPSELDFTTLEEMMRHVASYGCVAVVPDLSWLQLANSGDEAFPLCARVLVAYAQYLASLNGTLFANQVDISRVILAGHGEGAEFCIQAGPGIATAIGRLPVAYGLIAPLYDDPISIARLPSLRNVVVLGGTLDDMWKPADVYPACGTPKTLVTIPGANHYGYTDLCDANNSCDAAGVDDNQGTISRADQQATGGAYLAALVRYYALGDATARPYLTGQEAVEGLAVTGIQVQAAGFKPVVGPTPLSTAGTHP